nr:unnamed protein product [Callosobruchus chinensis]
MSFCFDFRCRFSANMGLPHQPCLLIFIVVLWSATAAECCTCAKMKTLGYTVPSGDITLRYGDALDITCNLCDNSTAVYGENASSLLYFERNDDLVPRDEYSLARTKTSEGEERYVLLFIQ